MFDCGKQVWGDTAVYRRGRDAVTVHFTRRPVYLSLSLIGKPHLVCIRTYSTVHTHVFAPKRCFSHLLPAPVVNLRFHYSIIDPLRVGYML